MKMIFPPSWAVWGLVLLQLFQFQVAAQSPPPRREKPPLPEGNLICGIGPKDSWTITFERVRSQKPNIAAGSEVVPVVAEGPVVESLRQPGRVIVTRVDPYLTVRFMNEAGKSMFAYYAMSNYLFVLDGIRNTPIGTDFPVRELGVELLLGEKILLAAREKKFHGFGLVTRQNYVGVETLDDVPCFVFQNAGYQAWIDQKNLRPVQWKSSDEIRRFKYNTTADPQIPPSVMARMEGIKADMERFKKSPKGG